MTENTSSSASVPSVVRVALVEDDPSTRERLKVALEKNPRLSLVFEASSAAQITEWLSERSPIGPEVLLVDLGLPDGSGLSVIEAARRLTPNTDTLVVSMFGDEANMIRAFESGAKGYLLKDGTHEDLAVHVMNLHEGGSPMSPIIARQLIARFDAQRTLTLGNIATPVDTTNSGVQPSSIEKVSVRELEVLRLIARGYTYPEIGKLLKVSVNTIHTHARNIYSKLAVSNKTEAVFEARNLGLLD
jgi:DNA-binding NarL/FixJ family response regulator